MFFARSARHDIAVIGASDTFQKKLSSILSAKSMTASFMPISGSLDPANFAKTLTLFIGITSQADIDVIRKFADRRPADQRLIAILDDYQTEFMRDLVRIGVDDIVTPQMSDAELLKSFDTPRRLVGGARRVMAFSPVLGGMGATTIAIETAVLLSQGGRSPTCLVDLDLYAGECSDFLNLQPRLEMDVLSGDESRIDEHLLDLVLSDHGSGIKLLAAQTRLGFTSNVNPKAILKLLEIISDSYENVIIDLPRSWQSWSDEIILGCDDVFLVSDSTIPALKAARRQLEEYKLRFDDKAHVKVIINKIETSFFRATAGEDDFKRTFGDAYVGSIADESRIARMAVDSGVPISSIKKSSKIIKNLNTIIGSVTH